MYRILLVEDERWVRTAIRKVIEKTGHPFRVVHESTNGMEAFHWLKENTVELVLTDIRMPEMDGITLIQELHSREMKIDVIIISGHDDFSYTQQAIRLGAFDYLLKPVESDSMSSSLQKWLEKKEKGHSQDKENEQNLEELSPIEQISKYIETSLGQDITLQTAASMVHLSPGYFCKLFKQKTGKNFSDYVIDVKMKEASRLLINTSLRISEIAEKLGYSDLAYFSNSYKKIVGVTPSNYRKQQKPSTIIG